MKIEGLKIHRKLSWFVAFFSLIVLIIVSLRKFLDIYNFYPIIHLTVEWILLGSLIIHCVLSQKYLKLWWIRIFKGLKNERSRPIYILRLIQLITNRVIIILAALVVLSGLGYYEWYAESIGIVIPFELHVYYDFFLLICIIIHVGVGFKFMFIRKRIKNRCSNLFIIIFCCSLTLIIIFLNIL
ncbi:MAG: hypothetical protein JSV62_06655 [Promethearchaeota archaeon]|nr:MAG: hypothetical protein JSV62_06655 [Candidatus Lokiarchaeota archaeon]